MRLKNLVSLVTALTLFGITSRAQETYESAVENPELRVSYVSNVCKRISIPTYVIGVEYSPTQDRDSTGTAMIQTSASTTFLGDGLKKVDSQISIMPLIFSRDSKVNRVHSDAELIFSLTKHEFRHAEVYHNGGKPIVQECIFDGELDTKLLKILSELEAHDNEVRLLWDVSEKGVVRKSGNGEVSFDYAVSTLNASREYYTKLQKYAKEKDNPRIRDLVERYRLPHYKFGKK